MATIVRTAFVILFACLGIFFFGLGLDAAAGAMRLESVAGRAGTTILFWVLAAHAAYSALLVVLSFRPRAFPKPTRPYAAWPGQSDDLF